jgi:hypothetical protein
MVLSLQSNEYLRLRGVRGMAIEVLSGRVWITEDGRGADRFLGAGRHYRVLGDGLVLVSAEGPVNAASVRLG